MAPDRSANDQLWADYARVYSRLRLLEPYRQLLEEVVTLADIHQAHNVLDVCCGDGALLWELQRRRLYPAIVLGIDNSPPMLDRARHEPYDGARRFRQADLDGNLAQWGLVEETVDRIICNNGLYALADPAATLRQLATVAKRGAVLVVSTPKRERDQNAVLQAHLSAAPQHAPDQRFDQGWILRQLLPLIRINQQLTDYDGTDEAGLRAWFENCGWEIDHLGETYGQPAQNWLVRAHLAF